MGLIKEEQVLPRVVDRNDLKQEWIRGRVIMPGPFWISEVVKRLISKGVFELLEVVDPYMFGSWGAVSEAQQAANAEHLSLQRGSVVGIYRVECGETVRICTDLDRGCSTVTLDGEPVDLLERHLFGKSKVLAELDAIERRVSVSTGILAQPWSEIMWTEALRMESRA
jgi:hypothetical protein